MSAPEAPNCYRCGVTGHVDWVDVSTLGEVEPRYLAGDSYCVTSGCTEPDGSRRLDAPAPEEMRRRADAAWKLRHERLVADR